MLNGQLMMALRFYARSHVKAQLREQIGIRNQCHEAPLQDRLPETEPSHSRLFSLEDYDGCPRNIAVAMARTSASSFAASVPNDSCLIQRSTDDMSFGVSG